tara:strand:+ start:2226 stop:2417 length:192 start_codon:yes stop_codon:yes gene_type:complete
LFISNIGLSDDVIGIYVCSRLISRLQEMACVIVWRRADAASLQRQVFGNSEFQTAIGARQNMA